MFTTLMNRSRVLEALNTDSKVGEFCFTYKLFKLSNWCTKCEKNMLLKPTLKCADGT